MRTVLNILLMTSILFGGGYWYYTALAGCDVPMTYRIGSVDSRFGLTEEQVRNAVSDAESMWEDATDRNLFTYAPEGDLTINFVYDERQAQTEAQEEFEAILDRKNDMSESVKAEYDSLIARYETLRGTYETQVAAYEKKLATYNKEVADWNARGGAPKDVFARLEKTQASLEAEEARLSGVSDQINTLVRKINTLGVRGNTIVSDYNTLVDEYNSAYGEGKEFTQGDYSDAVINIYEFKNNDELTIVLAHELGHALGIDHVEGETSIMYRNMHDQTLEEGLSAADLTAFSGSCGNKGTVSDTLEYIRKALLELLGKI